MELGVLCRDRAMSRAGGGRFLTANQEKGILPCCRSVLGLEMKNDGLDCFTPERAR